MQQIGLGGSCHWCMEAVFQSLKGVDEVQQGWIASQQEASIFSEAVLLSYNTTEISLNTLIEIHLATHSAASKHALRNKYRSAVYVFNIAQQLQVNEIFKSLKKQNESIITEVLFFESFKLNSENYLNYYLTDPERPFCKTWIEPKLKIVLDRFGIFARQDYIKLG